MVGGLVAVLVLAGGGFFAYKTFLTPEPPPPPPAKKATTPTVKTAPNAPTTPGVNTAQQTPAEILSQAAKTPSNAINKAKDAVTTREASGQTQIDLGDKPAAPADGASKTVGPVTKSSSAMTPIGKGVSASTPVEAAVEASPEFRSFVATAKISGVFQGSPSRAFINGRLARAGDVVEPNLGIMFASVDAERKQLVFKDKSGAIVSRKY